MGKKCIKCKKSENLNGMDICIDCLFDIAKETNIIEEINFSVNKEEYKIAMNAFNSKSKNYKNSIILSISAIIFLCILGIGCLIGFIYCIKEERSLFLCLLGMISLFLYGIIKLCYDELITNISNFKKHKKTISNIKIEILENKKESYKEKQKKNLSTMIEFYNYCKNKYKGNLETIDDNSLKIISKSFYNMPFDVAKKTIEEVYIIEMKIKKLQLELQNDKETKIFKQTEEIYNKIFNSPEPMNLRERTFNEKTYYDYLDSEEEIIINFKKLVLADYGNRMIDEENGLKYLGQIEIEEKNIKLTESNNIEVEVYFDYKYEKTKIINSSASINGICKVILYENQEEVGIGYLFLYDDIARYSNQKVLCKLNKKIKNLNDIEVKYIPTRIWLVEDDY